ncbi:MAG: DNA cytosine methyltransferase [Tannerellaceae bacterium]
MTKKNNFSKSISLSNILKDKKKGVQIFGSSSLNEDGSIMSFNEQLAVISHYIHNNNTNFGAPYEDKALDLMDDITKFISNSEIKNSLSNDPSIQYNLFNEFNEIPFPSQPQPRFTFIDLFAGIGGFRQAMQNLGGKCVFSSEWDEQAQKTYMLNYGEVPFGDITLEQTKQYIPDHFDILCAGFPCQAFSLAGKRLGFEETRGTLFFDVAEIIRRKQPRAFFLENVKGLKIHDKGKTLEVILRTLREDLGYYVPDPEVMNAKDFGVPQNRERIFIVGFHPETGITEFSYPKPSNKKVSIADIKEKDVVPSKYYLSTQYLQTLREHKARHANKGNGFGYEIIEDTDIANAIVVGGMGRERNLIIDHRLTDFTPTTRIKGEVNREGIRKMTPREWARLQGFPDNFIIGVADASAYKQFGNSVAVPAIQATASKIIEKIL